MEWKIEIAKKLEDLAIAGTLDEIIAILNLPSENYCEKRTEIILVDGKQQQLCLGCAAKGIKLGNSLSIGRIKSIIDFFAVQYGAKFITINGRGDPFHPKIKEDNLEKVCYAYKKYGIQAYVFTAGNNLDERTCKVLADCKTNVMISLFGNRFIDADFFAGKEYPLALWPLQNQAEIAVNLRRLITIYKEHISQPEHGVARIGMNYVISEEDLSSDCAKIIALKQAANDNGIFFVVNTNFQIHPDFQKQKILEEYARKYSDFHFRHSTAVNGQCQMGAGSSATIDFDGMMLRCPYMDKEKGDGLFQELSEERIRRILEGYMKDRRHLCVMREY